MKVTSQQWVSNVVSKLGKTELPLKPCWTDRPTTKFSCMRREKFCFSLNLLNNKALQSNNAPPYMIHCPLHEESEVVFFVKLSFSSQYMILGDKVYD